MDNFSHLCWKLSPKNDIDMNAVGCSIFDSNGKTLIFNKCGNYYFKHKLNEDDSLIRMAVYGGNVWNGAEHSLSEILIKYSIMIEDLIYVPDDTKGGYMIRPHYYKSDREKSETFSNLKSVTLNCNGLPILLRNYIAPTLEIVNIVISQRHIEQKNYDLIRFKLLEKFPSIKDVIICTRTNDEINPIKM